MFKNAYINIFHLQFSSITFFLEDLWGDFISFPWRLDELCENSSLG